MRILLLVPEYPPDTIGGGGEVFHALAQRFSKIYECRVVSGTTGLAPLPGDDGTGIVRIPELPLPRTLRYLSTTLPPTPMGARALRSAIAEVDVVHAHGFGFPVVDIGIRTAASRGIPVLHTLHGYPISQTRRGRVIKLAFGAYERFSGGPAIKKGSRHTAVSQPVAELFASRYGIAAETIPNGIDLPDAEPWSEFDRLLDDHGHVAVAVGRIDWNKGFDTIIRALTRIDPLHRPHFAFIGQDHGEAKALLALAATSGVSGWCHFTGPTSRARLAHAYSRASVCVVASHSEAFPAVPLEAMLSGCPLVATRLPAITSYASNEGNCLLYEAGDDCDLAVQLERMRTTPRLRRHITQSARNTAAGFSWSVPAERYAALFQTLVGNG